MWHLLMQLFIVGSSKVEDSKKHFDILITEKDHPRYVKHVVPHIHAAFILFWASVAQG